MHKMMVGVRIDGQSEPDFFGWDEVNDLIRHGMKVVAVVPGEFYEGHLDSAAVHSMVWYSTVVLDDFGIDPAEPDTAIDRGGNESTHEANPTGDIPWQAIAADPGAAPDWGRRTDSRDTML